MVGVDRTFPQVVQVPVLPVWSQVAVQSVVLHSLGSLVVSQSWVVNLAMVTSAIRFPPDAASKLPQEGVSLQLQYSTLPVVWQVAAIASW